MNVLVLVNHLESGGAEQFCVNLANALAEKGHGVALLSSGGALEPSLAREVATFHLPLRSKRPDAVWRAARAVRRLITERGIDVVHANSTNTALAARLARGSRPIPVVATAHGSWFGWRKAGAAAAFALGADRVVGCSRWLLDDLIRHGLPDRLGVSIPNGIPTARSQPGNREALRAELNLPPDARLVLGVGRLIPEKGFQHLIAAMSGILATRPETMVAIAGSGPYEATLVEQAKALGVASAVRFLGFRRDVSGLLSAADVLCAPSCGYEGLPLAVAEAMAQGLPVVASDLGGIPELVVPGETGLLVPVGDVEAIARALLDLVGDDARRARLGSAGRDRVMERFSLERMVSAYEALYREERSRLARPHRTT